MSLQLPEQATTGTVGQQDMPPWIVDLLTNAGPIGAIMGYMWWTERKRADVMTGKLLDALEKQNEYNDAVRAVLEKREKDGG